MNEKAFVAEQIKQILGNKITKGIQLNINKISAVLLLFHDSK
jgi:hypothetical protein